MNVFNTSDHCDNKDLGPLADLPTVAAARPDEFSSDANIDATNHPPQIPQQTDSTQDPAFRRLLQAIVINPGLPSSKYPKLACMSPRKAVAARNQLVEQKLIRETELQTKARGRSAIVLTPTEKGTALISDRTSDSGGSEA